MSIQQASFYSFFLSFGLLFFLLACCHFEIHLNYNSFDLLFIYPHFHFPRSDLSLRLEPIQFTAFLQH